MIDFTIFNNIGKCEVDVQDGELTCNRTQRRRGVNGGVPWSDASMERCLALLNSVDLKRDDFNGVERGTLEHMASRFRVYNLTNGTDRRVECILYRCLLKTDQFSDSSILNLIDTGMPFEYVQKLVGSIGNIEIS